MPTFAPLPITLASGSPQRRALIARLGLEVTIQPSMVDEEQLAVPDDPAEKVRALALAKALDVALTRPSATVLGADTLVALSGAVLGKPGTDRTAAVMLRRLSGRAHVVLTGLAVITALPNDTGRVDAASLVGGIEQGRQIVPDLQVTLSGERCALTAVVASTVEFHHLSDGAIAAYVQTGEPLDKAGAYGIQGEGSRLVASLTGCFTNVVGLPLCAVAALLSAVGGHTIACPADPDCRLGGVPCCHCP